jgi:gliding motility-associated-like protein
MRALIFALIWLLIVYEGSGQTCTNAGQTPSTAFPVCGSKVFTQTTVPLCGGAKLPAIHCPNDGVTDRNPYWYKFTCLTAGTLGFIITPKTLDEDYDWELYDITGLDPNAVYTNGNIVVACNWSGEFGVTGASTAGTNRFVCAGYGQDLYSSMPQLQVGHEYLLLISHFTNTQSGYTLEFKGGGAVITDTAAPRINTSAVNCSRDVITIALKKKVKCSSLAINGSDFFLTPSAGVSIIGATSPTCALNQFDTDTIRLQLDQSLPPGNYAVGVKRGTDNNTLLDYCDLAMPLTETTDFTVLPNQPTPMDSLTTPGCAANTLRLVFRKPIRCSSIAADGSDFVVNGTYPINVSSAVGNCSNGLTTSILVTLSQPMQRKGNFVIQLQAGTDGNTILDECAVETPAGSSIAFQVKDTVNADFTYSIQYGCSVDVVNFSHPGNNEVNKWAWKLDQGITSSQQLPQANYTVFTPKNVELIVSNGVCSDTSRKTIVLENFISADFTTYPDNCPLEPVAFTATAVGKITRHDWNFGDGNIGTGITTSHIFSQPTRETVYNVRYTVTDSFGCTKTVQKPVKIYSSCLVRVPNAFSPNNNRSNEFLYPLNAVKAEQLEFTVYNRWGQMVFRTTDWKQGWDGRLYGQPQPQGTYVWILRYIDRDTRKRIEQKGFTILIR